MGKKKCISCGSDNGIVQHFDGGFVCEKCIGDYFTCPDCGMVFDQDDRVNGDGGNGFCVKHAIDH